VARHASAEASPTSRHSEFDVSPALDELVLAYLKKIRSTVRPPAAS
jgi:hypothetical protein